MIFSSVIETDLTALDYFLMKFRVIKVYYGEEVLKEHS